MSNLSPQYRDTVIQLDTNIDDSTAEELGYCVEQLLAAGVLDAWFTPIYMKKGRPAYQLSVLCKPDREEQVVRILFRHTTSIGLRRSETERIVMDREPVTLDTPYGPVQGKRCTYEDLEKVSVEYEDARRLAEANGVRISEILRSAK